MVDDLTCEYSIIFSAKRLKHVFVEVKFYEVTYTLRKRDLYRVKNVKLELNQICCFLNPFNWFLCCVSKYWFITIYNKLLKTNFRHHDNRKWVWITSMQSVGDTFNRSEKQNVLKNLTIEYLRFYIT